MPKIEANINGKNIAQAQPREETRLQQRTLAQAGNAEQNREAVALNQGVQFFYIGSAASEEIFVLLPERSESRPGVLIINDGLCCFGG